jgi:hypothetical protein
MLGPTDYKDIGYSECQGLGSMGSKYFLYVLERSLVPFRSIWSGACGVPVDRRRVQVHRAQ